MNFYLSHYIFKETLFLSILQRKKRAWERLIISSNCEWSFDSQFEKSWARSRTSPARKNSTRSRRCWERKKKQNKKKREREKKQNKKREREREKEKNKTRKERGGNLSPFSLVWFQSTFEEDQLEIVINKKAGWYLFSVTRCS